MKKTIILLLVIIYWQNGFSQFFDPQAYEYNSAKYWEYRERLKLNSKGNNTFKSLSPLLKCLLISIDAPAPVIRTFIG